MNQEQLRAVLASNTNYNDQYDPDKHWSFAAFRPDQTVSSEDLNEMQSESYDQIRRIGDNLFSNGTVLSGMKLSSVLSRKPTDGSADNSKQNQKTQNLLTLESISDVNAVINKNNWDSAGAVDVAPESEEYNDYPGINLQLTNIPQDDPTITVSFTVQATEGNLYNLEYDYPSTAKFYNYKIDNSVVGSASNQNINLADGQLHTVSFTLKFQQAQLANISITANHGFDMLQQANAVRFTLGHLMVNVGNKAQPWTQTSVNTLPDKRNQIINVSDGYVWLGGLCRQFDSQNINIVGKGKETIGLVLNFDMASAPQNLDLYDTTKGAISEGERLADRVHYNVQLTYNDPNAVPLYTLIDGKLISNNSSSGSQKLDALLAERTYDQSGSYRVSGFNFWTTADADDPLYADLHIDAGIAYVMGYGVYQLNEVTKRIKVSNSTGSAQEEPLIFPYNEDKIVSRPLAKQPIDKSSVEVFGPLLIKGTYTNDVTPDESPDHNMHKMNMINHNFAAANPDQLPPVFSNGISVPFVCHWATEPQGDPYTIQVLCDYDDTTYIFVNKPSVFDNPDIYINRAKECTWHLQNGLQIVGDNTISWDGVINNLPENNDGSYNGGDYVPGPSASESTASGAGYTYFVDGVAPTYQYHSPYGTPGTADFQILTSQDENLYPGATSGNIGMNARIAFNVPGTSGLEPPVKSNEPFATGSVHVDYKYYNSQVGILALDKDGHFHVIYGNPAPYGSALPPEQIDPDMLKLGYITLTPNYWTSNCEFSSVTRIPFSGLENLASRVSNLETELQNDLLIQESKTHIDPTAINGMINDDFTTLAGGDVTNPNFSVAYDLSHGIISLRDDADSVRRLDFSLDDAATGNFHRFKHTITLPFSEKSEVGQSGINGSIHTLNMTSTDSANGLLELSPEADDYVDGKSYQFDLNGPQNIELHNWFTYTHRAPQNPYLHLDKNYKFSNTFNTRGFEQASMMKNTGLQTSATANEYIPTDRVIHFATSWLKPNSTGYYILLNDRIPVSAIAYPKPKPKPAWESNYQEPKKPVTPTSIQGTPFQVPNATDDHGNPETVQTVNVNEYGYVKGMFKLPAGQLTGIKKISLTNSPDLMPANGETVSNSYIANGIDNDSQATVEHRYNATDKFGDSNHPQLSQLIQTNDSSVLTSVNLMFITLPQNQYGLNGNVLVQLRTVRNNYPTNTVIAQCTLSDNDISSQMTRQNYVNAQFDDPVFVPAETTIALTISTNSPNYSLATYQASGPELSQSKDTSFNLFPVDHMITSNGVNWTDYGNRNLYFELNRASFTSQSNVIQFSAPAPDENTISKVALLADYITPHGSSLSWDLTVSYGVKPKETTTVKIPISSRRLITKITDDILSLSYQKDKHPKRIFNFTLKVTLNGTKGENNNDIMYSPIISLDTLSLATSETPYIDNSVDPDHLTPQRDDIDCATNAQGQLLDHGKVVNPDTDSSLSQYSYGNMDPKNAIERISYVTKTENKQQVQVPNRRTAPADGVYISRQIYAPTPYFNTITTAFDAHENSNCRVIPAYTIDGGITWHYYPANVKKYEDTSESMPEINYPKVTPVDSVYNHYVYKTQIPGGNPLKGEGKRAKTFQMALLLFTNSPYDRPTVRRLTNILTIENGLEDDKNRPYTGANSTNQDDWNSDPNNPSSSQDWRNNFTAYHTK